MKENESCVLHFNNTCLGVPFVELTVTVKLYTLTAYVDFYVHKSVCHNIRPYGIFQSADRDSDLRVGRDSNARGSLVPVGKNRTHHVAQIRKRVKRRDLYEVGGNRLWLLPIIPL